VAGPHCRKREWVTLYQRRSAVRMVMPPAHQRFNPSGVVSWLHRVVAPRGCRVVAVAARREPRPRSGGEGRNLVLLDIGIPGHEGEILALRLRDQHPVDGIAMDHREAAAAMACADLI
jgi:hypothetical protein